MGTSDEGHYASEALPFRAVSGVSLSPESRRFYVVLSRGVNIFRVL